MADDPLIGSVLGRRYRVLHLLGRGGMGRVYEAEHLLLGKRFALKVLNWEISDDTALRERFLREPRMASEINHPNIIRVSDVDEDDGRLYIVMDLIEGPDLRQLLRAGPIGPDRTLQLIAQAAAALDHAHSRGLVHRDVKPANILVGSGDQVVLTDFGLAKSSRMTHQLTVSGGFFGTIAYAAPEQFDSRGAEAASDRYALGCVLWECLSGRVPYFGDTDLQVMRGHLESDVPSVGGKLPAALNDVFRKALAKDPRARFETASALVDATGSAFADEARGQTRFLAPRIERPSIPDAYSGAEAPAPPVVPARDDVLPLGAEASRATTFDKRPAERPPTVVEVAPVRVGAGRRLVRGIRKPIVLAAVALPVAAIAGLALGDKTASTTHRAASRTVTQPAPSPRNVSSNGLRVTLPAEWNQRKLPPPLGALSKTPGLSAGPAKDPSSFIAVLAPTSALWLPPGTTAHGAQVVKLGSLQALRFAPRELRLAKQADFAMVLYGTATSRGDVLIACGRTAAVTSATGALARLPLSASFLAGCERLASTVAVQRARALPVLPAKAQIAAARVVLGDVGATRRSEARALASSTRATQIAAADALARAYASGATRFARLSPTLGIRGARATVITDVRAEATAFRALSAAGKAGSASAWTTASANIGRRDASLRAALRRLDAALSGKAYAL